MQRPQHTIATAAAVTGGVTSGVTCTAANAAVNAAAAAAGTALWWLLLEDQPVLASAGIDHGDVPVTRNTMKAACKSRCMVQQTFW
jgi:hypothetical protein